MSDRVTISDDDLRQWAGYLLNHSLGGVQAAERVMIKGEPITLPLMQLLSVEVIKAGVCPTSTSSPRTTTAARPGARTWRGTGPSTRSSRSRPG